MSKAAKENWALSCRCLTWFLGHLSSDTEHYWAIRERVESNLAWRMEQLDTLGRRRFVHDNLKGLVSPELREQVELPNTAPKYMLLFVHGLGGASKTTWGRFPDFITADPDLAPSFEVHSYEYPTSFFRLPFTKKAPDIETLAEGLRTFISNRLTDERKVVLACHSLGGLVARKYIQNEDLTERKLPCGVIFFATPHKGAALANVAKVISWKHGQLRDLCSNGQFVEELNDNWARRRLKDRLTIRCVYGGQDWVATKDTCKLEAGDDLLECCPACDHFSLVKPASPNDESFKVMRRFLLSIMSADGVDVGTRRGGQLALSPSASSP